MIVQLCHEPDVEHLRRMLGEISVNPDTRAVLVLACDANAFAPEQVDPILRECPLPLFGGCFPKILTGNQHLDTGTMVVGLRDPVEIAVVKGLSDDRNDLENDVGRALEDIDCAGRTIFTFVDGLSSRIHTLIEGLFNHLGCSCNYLGGGAGSLSLKQKPCLFTNHGLIEDAAVLAVSDVASGIGVAHGWKPISNVFKLTEARQNRAISLNWEPAFQVYREAVEAHSGLSFDDHPFFDIAKAYPLGILKLDTEMVIRDPICMEKNELVCVGEIPKGSFVHIMHGSIDSLIEGAEIARDTARRSYAMQPITPTLFLVDCISRALFMGDDITQELSTVAQDAPTIGAMTIGEIANTGHTCLEFYNKTVVAGLLGDSYEEGNLQGSAAGAGVLHQR